MNLRNLGEAARVINLAPGTISAGAAGGTANGAPLGQFEYVTVAYIGTFQNNGTINVYATTGSNGSNPQVIRTLNIGSSDSPWAAIDIKSSAMGSLNAGQGSTYTHIGAYGTVESGAMWRGALCIICYNARVAPPGTSGLAAYGTYLT